MSPERVWAEWLDAVESAARSVEQQALVGEAPPQSPASPGPSMPSPMSLPMSLPMALPMPVPMPELPWPASLEGRRREVLATLAAATETLERRRDETASALSRLAHAPSRPVAAGYADGTALDVLG